MNLRVWQSVAVLVVLCCLPVHSRGVQPDFVLSELPIPPEFTVSRATAMNNRGQVVGWAATADDVCHAMLWDNGTVTDLGTAGGSDSLASCISASGEIAGVVIRNMERHIVLWWNRRVINLGMVDEMPTRLGAGNFNTSIAMNPKGEVIGQMLDRSGGAFCFLYRPAEERMTWLSGPEGTVEGYPRAINDRGQIVGQTWRSYAPASVFLWHKGKMMDVGGLDGAPATANAVNEDGTIAGWVFIGTFFSRTAHAFVWTNGQMRDLGTLGGKTSRALALNNAGQVVGYSETAPGEYAAFLWENGTMVDLNTRVAPAPGWRVTCGDAINDRGEIAVYCYKNDQRRAAVLLPVVAGPAVRAAVRPTEPTLRLSYAPPTDPAGPRLSASERLPSGSVRLEFSRAAGNYIVETSSDLQTWTPLCRLSSVEGKLEIIDADAPRFNFRFYRVLQER